MVNIQNLLETMSRDLFTDIYWNSLWQFYEDQKASGMIGIEEKEFEEGSRFLDTILTEEQKTILARIDNCYNIMWNYVVENGFYYGLALGFEMISSPEENYQKVLMELFGGALLSPQYGYQHKTYYRANEEALQYLNELNSQLNDEAKEYLISVELGYDQRVHSATLNALYIGLLAVAEITKKINPQATAKILEFILRYELYFTYRGKPWSVLDYFDKERDMSI